MPDIITFSQHAGHQRVWVPEADVEWWLRFWGRQGRPAARWRDYRAWGGFWPTEPADTVMLRRTKRTRTNYARWIGT
jgi:hypothetical protein